MHIKNVLVCHMISLYISLRGNPTLWQGGASFNLAELSEHDVWCHSEEPHGKKKLASVFQWSTVSEPTEAAEKNSCKLLYHLWATCTSDYHVCWPLIVFCLQSGVKLTQLSTRSLAIKTDPWPQRDTRSIWISLRKPAIWLAKAQSHKSMTVVMALSPLITMYERKPWSTRNSCWNMLK